MTGKQLAEKHLLQVLDTHGISYSRDTIAAAFADSTTSTEITEWVGQWLGEDTLLGVEELKLYEKLLETGTIAELESRGQGGGGVSRFVTEKELVDATSRLQKATKEIQKQNEVLRAQKVGLDSLRKWEGGEGSSRAIAEKKKRDKWSRERALVGLAAEELIAELENAVKAANDRDVGKQNEKLDALVRETLRSDDQILAKLGEVRGSINRESALRSDGEIARVEKMGKRLATYRAEALRCRLDRLYLETSGETKDSSQEDEANQEEIRSLQAELQSLYPEISSLAEISAQEEHVNPIVREISQKGQKNQQDNAAKLEYIQQSLEHLVSRLEATTDRIYGHKAHENAMKTLVESIKVELKKAQPQSPAPTRSPTRRRLSGSTRRSPARRKSIDDQPERQLLRHFGISLPQGQPPSVAIENIARERQEKLRVYLNSLESTTEATFAGNVGDGDKANRILLDALLADSKNSTVTLIEEELANGVDELEAGIGDVGKGLAGVDIERFAKRDKSKEQFVRRWAR